MNKKKIIIYSAILIIAVSTAAVYFIWPGKTNFIFYKNVNQKSDESTSPRVNNASSSIEEINDIFSKALAEGKIENCASINDTSQSDLCIKLISVKLLDEKKCVSIKDLNVKKECLDDVNRRKADDEKNPEKCKEIQANLKKESCFMSYINSNNFNESECKKLDIELAGLCLDKFYYKQSQKNKDIKICENIKDNDGIEECIVDIFYDKKDISLCESLSGIAKDVCKNLTGYLLAVEKIDAKYCQNIIDETKKNDCIKEVEDISDNDNDGLSNHLEKTYGTDTDKKDTDGDGHTDGEEVKNGFNPIGEGKLNANNK